MTENPEITYYKFKDVIYWIRYLTFGLRAISFYKSWKINMYALETTSLVFECSLAHRQL